MPALLRFVLTLLLVAGCSAAAPGASPTAALTSPPTSAPTAAPSPTGEPTEAPTPSAAPTDVMGTPYCDPDAGYGCDAETPSARPSAEPTTAGEQVVVATAGEPDPYLVDPDGLSLYTFDNDAPGVSNCSGDCSASWPPLLVEPGVEVVADGPDGDLATIERGDVLQVTYNGAPLYYFSGDSAPGETNGEGIGGVWHLATP